MNRSLLADAILSAWYSLGPAEAQAYAELTQLAERWRIRSISTGAQPKVR